MCKRELAAELIVSDGWARGFRVAQTVRELHAMGFTTLTEADVLADWKRQDQEYDDHAQA